MNKSLFTIPNMLTLANLLCGSLAIISMMNGGSFTTVFFLVLAAAFFDLLDGAVARLLKQNSPIGAALDSLSDLVSFGLVPSLVLYKLIEYTGLNTGVLIFDQYGKYLALLVALFSALRLANYTVNCVSCSEFEGLPVPANALLITSLGYIYEVNHLGASALAYTILGVVMSCLLICEVEMFSLKFKSFAFKGNLLRYSFLAVSFILVVALGFGAMPAIITLYIVMSIASSVIKKMRCNAKK